MKWPDKRNKNNQVDYQFDSAQNLQYNLFISENVNSWLRRTR